MKPDLTQTAMLLALQGAAIRTCAALEAAGVPVLLIKGPVTSAWLYGGINNRRYGDIDLLIAPSHLDVAVAELRRCGYHSEHAKQLGIYLPYNESAWSRDGLVIDLHTSLVGIPAGLAERAMAEFLEASVPFNMHGAQLRSLCIAHRCLHASLHVAQSRADERALRDLDLALEVASDSDWNEAWMTSERLAPTGAFVAGMRGSAAGRSWLAEQQRSSHETLETRLRAAGALPEAVALAGLLALPARTRRPLFLDWFRVAEGRATARQKLTVLFRLARAILQIAGMSLRRSGS